ncbi:DUF4328 domain-containing protein [Streptomyces himalayensis]|uniref:DUF4328 domain-containing protein n=1 Tax=Streptomyces himalayensis subsp. himalayensis TaxID=2756131 RepID=A0A7W0I9X6_9ACTN|nr:DUF4328 domain-containing protein [Streptomyces himalayensis]MBA2947780.1 DUF4328 domain-containing protein [Streptomyces himalayensis subsp. himalayensis]
MCAALALTIAADLFSIYAGLAARSQVGPAFSDTASMSALLDWNQAQLVYSRAGSAQLLLLVVTACVFLVWFSRARRNGEVFALDGFTRKPGWAVGSWFVPVGNLWMPYRIAVEIWRASSPGRTSPTLVNAWWAAWITASLLSWFGGQSYGRAEEADAIEQAVSVLLLADVLDIAAAVLAMAFVWRLSGMQDAKATHAQGPLTSL